MLNPNLYDFVFGIINLVVLYIFLRKLLFKPVTKFMDNRTNSIKAAIDSANNDKATAAELKHLYEEHLRNAKIEASQIINDSHTRASHEYDEIINAAKIDSGIILSKAREEIENEKEQMLKDIKNQVASLALAAASKVIEANMNTENNKALVQKFIDEVGAA